ncbi:unnamed protein product [Parascedosporium putredinis]|uniref:Cytochrome P450 n=1 Tax=Parascedosporium putredinis TaxID=1442378 RepID=A0A9P1H4Q0_9PEZI|nr:unnamed protein product [Parascedosporium putredinis]CAI7996816.1 unnamed protein product [Parascedosporium putredinis]
MTSLLVLKPTTIAVGVVVISLVARLLMVGRRPKNLPPGLQQSPSSGTSTSCRKEILMLGTQTMIVLSTDRAVKDLLDKRSNKYSHRQEMYICHEGYGARWRSARKQIHTLLNVSAAKSYVPYQLLENKQMLYEILTKPDDFLFHIRRYSNALTTTMIYGWRTPRHDDKRMQEFFEEFAKFSELNQTGAAATLDCFPILRLLPEFMSSTKRKAKHLQANVRALYLGHWLTAKKASENSSLKPCFCDDLATVQKKEDISDAQAAFIAGTLLEAGSDTTSSTLYAFVQAMLLYPDVQQKAFEEIDREVGPDRLPTMEDEFNLPYIRACIKEVIRWMPTTILGAVPHAVTEDDWYEGYLIPKNAGVMNNSLADAAANPDPTKRDQFTFGAGRRICPGIHVAERSLFLGMSRMLWAFKIEPKLDAAGKPILPDPDRLTQGFVCLPEPFEATFTPRSAERTDRVRTDWAEAEAECLDPETKQWRVAQVASKVRKT